MKNELCDQSNKKNILRRLQDKERKNQRNPIYLDHSRAVELCLHVDRSSMDPTKTLQIKYVPIRVDVDERNVDHIVHKCIFWKFIPCRESKYYLL